MHIKENKQVWCTSFFDKKTRAGASVNEDLTQYLHKPVLKIYF